MNRQACRPGSAKDTDIQTHMGEHIRKAIREVSEDGIKYPVAKSYPRGTCGRSMTEHAQSMESRSTTLMLMAFHHRCRDLRLRRVNGVPSQSQMGQESTSQETTYSTSETNINGFAREARRKSE
ncbi:hypothetical protein R3P38DRAFT_2803375 [Favolaschia claudopus]|uniref:Uncharacterized protein n=1 Tax=Favolaschia claudopus TaxID=2862362 RepID=A0AAV9ZSM3_9AGAR